MKTSLRTKLVTALLVLGILLLPQQETKAVTLVEACVAIVVVGVGVTIYIVVKKSSKCLDKPRCDTCGRLLPGGVWTCPTCGSVNVPPPPEEEGAQGFVNLWNGSDWVSPTNMVLQCSTNGSDWEPVYTMGWYPLVEAEIEYYEADDIAEWLAAHPGEGPGYETTVVAVRSRPQAPSAMYRLVTE